MKTVEHTKKFRINTNINKAFPLFSPEGEKLWVPNWDYSNIMGTDQLTEDYIFTTDSHDHKLSTAIWTIKGRAGIYKRFQLFQI